ncbi:MAG: DUF2958 domain-containing protein [Candidatus Woesebacteria bacterium]
MQLLTQELKKQFPAIYSTEESEDPLVMCRYFLPMTKWEWFVTEFDGTSEFFGYVVGQYTELGYFTLNDLRTARGPFGFQVERDCSFTPAPLSKIKQEVKGGAYATV